jgi:hypothetical protein
MPDRTFESLLTDQLRQYAEAGVRPIDRFAIAEGTIATGRRSIGSRLFGPRRGALLPILIGLLVLALATSVALVGARLLAPLLPIQHTYRGEFAGLPDLSRPIAYGALVPLVDGRVLVMGTGGDGGDPTWTAELYDPATGASKQLGPIPTPLRFVDSAVRLKDGRALILGDGAALIFDPTTMRFDPVGPMVTPKRTAAAVLGDGRVLIAGGDGPASAELFDPATLTFSATGSMGTTDGPLATLPDGRVFVAGDPAQVYDPTTGTFSAAGRTSSSFSVSNAISLPDGRVVVFGSGGGLGHHLSYTEVWDPTSRTFSTAIGDRGDGLGLHDPPGGVQSAALLDDGRIFLMDAGRFVLPAPNDQGPDPSWSGIYDPATGVTTLTEKPQAWSPMVTRLRDGRLLLVGGLRDGRTYIGNGDGSLVLEAPAVPTVQIFQ